VWIRMRAYRTAQEIKPQNHYTVLEKPKNQ